MATQSKKTSNIKKRVIRLLLSDDTVIEKRTRYNIWDLLGDVGGFNDGLILVCQLFTGVYSAVSFKTSFLASSYFDSSSYTRGGSSHERRSTIAAIMDPNYNRLDPSTAQTVFKRALRSAKLIQQSFLGNFLFWMCQERRKKMLESRIMHRMER